MQWDVILNFGILNLRGRQILILAENSLKFTTIFVAVNVNYNIAYCIKFLC